MFKDSEEVVTVVFLQLHLINYQQPGNLAEWYEGTPAHCYGPSHENKMGYCTSESI